MNNGFFLVAGGGGSHAVPPVPSGGNSVLFTYAPARPNTAHGATPRGAVCRRHRLPLVNALPLLLLVVLLLLHQAAFRFCNSLFSERCAFHSFARAAVTYKAGTGSPLSTRSLLPFNYDADVNF